MTRKQSSPRLSSIEMAEKDATLMAAEIRSLAACVLTQDETK